MESKDPSSMIPRIHSTETLGSRFSPPHSSPWLSRDLAARLKPIMDKPSPSNKTPAQARKERKRENDRLAQREHRKRQRQYVEELEAQLELFRQAPGAGELSSLLEENQQLRKEVNCNATSTR
jgi:hypothetical protein